MEFVRPGYLARIFARALAAYAHEGQKRGDGSPYFPHVQRVADRVAYLGDDAVIVAYLHDIIEDTHLTYEHIRDLFGRSIALDVDTLTRRPGISYQSYIDDIIVCGSDLALAVKIADLADNLIEPEKGTEYHSRWLSLKEDRYERVDAILREEQQRREDARGSAVHDQA